MLLENLVLGRTVEINVYREEYRYHLVSKVESTSASRLCVTLIASNNKAFQFKPDDRIKIVYRDSEKIWEWDNVKAGVIKKGKASLHYFDIVDGGSSFNRRNAYRVTINQETMIGYYDQYGTTAKSSEMQKFDLSEEASAPPNLTVPQFVHGYVRDISETGVGICSNYEFNIDDGMFLNIQSHYGKLPVRAKVVRKADRNPAKHKYAKYYGCVLLQTDNKLSKYIFDIQRMSIKSQKEREDEEELRKELKKLERGILYNKSKSAGSGLHIKGIKTVSDMEDKVKTMPRQKVEGIVTADEVQEREVKIRQRQKIEGIITEEEAGEIEMKKEPVPRQKIEGIKTAADVEEEMKKRKENKEPSPAIEGIKTAGLK